MRLDSIAGTRWGLATALALLAILVSPAQPSTTGCSGIWHSGNLVCSGSSTCIGDDRCNPIPLTDTLGQYFVCMCNASEQEPACCHTIKRNGAADYKGTCSKAPPWNCPGGPCVDMGLGADFDYQCNPPPPPP